MGAVAAFLDQMKTPIILPDYVEVCLLISLLFIYLFIYFVNFLPSLVLRGGFDNAYS